MKRSEFVLAAGGAAAVGSLAARTNGADGVLIVRLHWAGISLIAGNAQLFLDPVTEFSSDPVPHPEVEYSFALVSHYHNDHFDPKNLALAIGKKGFVVLEEQTARIADHHMLPTQVASMYQPVFLPRMSAEFCAFAVPAVDGMGTPQNSWVIDVRGMRLLHLGDTQWHGGFWQVARAYGPIDVLFVPINGYQQVAGRYRQVGVPMSLSPSQAAAALEIFEPRLAIPIHYGEPSPPTYLETDHPLRTFLELTKRSSTQVRPLQQGEGLHLTRSS